MPGFEVRTLLTTPLFEVRDVLCAGMCRHKGDIERSARTTLVFPYRGTYVRHLGDDEAVADASQVLFFNAGEAYQVSHPNAGGDASLALTVDDALLREIAPPALLLSTDPLRFRALRLRIDPRGGRHPCTAAARGPREAGACARPRAALDIGRRGGGSRRVGVYLTQSFRDVEDVPLYRYQLRLHFTAAFQQAYGRTPSEFRQAALPR